ncbi:MAG TPA: L,D-transpeptidase [Polyangia bacterium]|nr:L,D-transpeptidase [Polyangia bacterium]
MIGRRHSPRWLPLAAVALGGFACHPRKPAPPSAAVGPTAVEPSRPPIPHRAAAPALSSGETLAYDRGVAKKMTIPAARGAGLLDVDLSNGWAPYILQDGDPPQPNDYRQTFVGLANDRLDADGDPARAGNHNYLEAFGIPPTLSVLAARADEDASAPREACYDAVDREGLERFTGEVGFLDRDRSKRDYAEAVRDGDWLAKEIAARQADASLTREAAIEGLRADPKARGRVDREARGQARVRAVRAAQARLLCEGLLSPRSRFVSGMYDLPTHEALAAWERKNDIFGWGFLGGETLGSLLRPTRELLLDDLRRIFSERLADAANIVEDGSINLARRRNPPTWRDEAGAAHPVPDLIDDHVNALLAAVGVNTAEDAIAFLRAHRAGFDNLHVAFKAPALPAYYQPEPGATEMNLVAEIDRGDVWYDFPFDARGKPSVQRRDHYPHLTLFVKWHGQKIPLCWWRTTIGSWRSELHADGHVYFKYKNSDVGPRVWKQIVAAPVWIPPDGTPVEDLLTHKVLDRNVGPVTVVKTDVMGPGYQSAYGLVMGIHVDPKRGDFDNQIRTHGSVDYTSIARRFSHGCHRLVNNRAVRLFDFVLRHRTFRRVGNVPMNLKKHFEVDGQTYRYAIKTRGYYYELVNPVPVDVLDGRIMGEVKKPITAFVRKPGIDYGEAPAVGDAASTGAAPPGPETTPELGP